MKKNQLLLLILLAATVPFCAYPPSSAGQAEATTATVFPEKLLGGNPDFGFAVSLQADERGNFGPCG